MDKLDDIVLDVLGDKLLTERFVENLLAGLLERQTARDEDHAQRLSGLKGKLADAEERLKRLYQAIENGVADPTDPTLKERIGVVKTERDIAHVALTRAAAELSPEARITGEKIAVAVEAMRANVLQGPIPFRRAYLRAMIDNVEVDDTEVRIYGRRTVLERLVMGDGVAPAGVPSFVRKWRAREDETGNCYVIVSPI
jgi:hypothetical protein